MLEDAIDALDESQSALRFSLEAEVAVLAVTSREARRGLADRMAEFRARASAIAGVAGAAPLLAVVARELADTDGTAKEVALHTERALEEGRLLSREGAVLGIGTTALVICDRPARAEAKEGSSQRRSVC